MYDTVTYKDYIVQAKAGIYIETDGVAIISCSTYGYKNITTKVEIIANLQQYTDGKWITLETCNIQNNSHRIILDKRYKINKGFYRVNATIKAYNNNNIETVILASNTASY